MKKILISGIAAMSLIGFTACGSEKKDKPEPTVECTSSDECTDASKPFCNANGVCVADPNPGPIDTDASVDNDASVPDAGLECPAEKPYEVNGECSKCPADQPYEIDGSCYAEGQICPKGGFDDFCVGSAAIYCYQGRVVVSDCDGDTCLVIKDDMAAYCVPESVICKPGDAPKAGCGSDQYGEYKANFNCDIETTTPGVGILSVDQQSIEDCDVHCFEKATGPECGVNFEGEYDECDPAQFEERCETNENGTFAVWCKKGLTVAPKCGEGTVCGFADDWGVDCFKPCTELDAEIHECDAEYPGDYNIYECVQELNAQGEAVEGKYVTLQVDWDTCESGVCDFATNECAEGSGEQKESCKADEYEPSCDGNTLLQCGPAGDDLYSAMAWYFGGEGVVLSEDCAGTCVADANSGVVGCMNKWDECTAGDDPIFFCTEDSYGETSVAYACVPTSGGKAYWVTWGDEDCDEDYSCADTEDGNCGDTAGLCDSSSFTETCDANSVGNYCSYGFIKMLDCSGEDDACISEVGGNYINCVSNMPDECPEGVEAGSTYTVCETHGVYTFSVTYECKAMSDNKNRGALYDYEECDNGCDATTGECAE